MRTWCPPSACDTNCQFGCALKVHLTAPLHAHFLYRREKRVQQIAKARKQIVQESRARSGAYDILGYNNCKDDDAQLWYKQCSNVQLATNGSY